MHWRHAIPGLALCLALTSTTSLAQTPAASPAWTATDQRAIEVDGIPLVLSPDGGWIAGIGEERDTLCVWDVETLNPACAGDFGTPITHTSVTWAPDSSAVAFSLDAPIMFRDSDIYVFELATHSVVNLTEDDPDRTGADKLEIDSSKMDHSVSIDLYPAWSPDSQELVFARTDWGSPGEPGTTLMTIPREGGEPEKRHAVTPTEPMVVWSPMAWLEDGSVLYSDWRPDAAAEQNGIWHLAPDGTTEHVFVPGDTAPGPQLASVTPDGERASIISRLNQGQFAFEPGTVFFDVDLTTGDATPWEEAFGLPLEPAEAYRDDSPGILSAPPVFSPDGTAIAFATRTMDDTVRVSVMDQSGIAWEVVTIEREPDSEPAMAGSQLAPWVTWAENDTLLILSNAGIVLATLDPPA